MHWWDQACQSSEKDDIRFFLGTALTGYRNLPINFRYQQPLLLYVNFLKNHVHMEIKARWTLLTVYHWSFTLLIGSSEDCSTFLVVFSFFSKLISTLWDLTNIHHPCLFRKHFTSSTFSPTLKWSSGSVHTHTLVTSTETPPHYQLQKLSFSSTIYLEKSDYPVRLRISCHRERTSAHRRDHNGIELRYFYDTCVLLGVLLLVSNQSVS